MSKNNFYKSRFSSQAYTLMEIVIVTMIVGILASLAFYNYGVVVEKARAKEGEQSLLALFAARQRYITENNGQKPITLNQLDVQFRPSKYFLEPSLMNNGGLVGQIINGRIKITNLPGPPPQVIKTVEPDYILQIRDDGTIICSNDLNPHDFCSRAGY